MKLGKFIATALVGMLGCCDYTHAAGFAILEQSASMAGSAYAGGAAEVADASTVFFNPAGMTRLCGDQAVVGAQVIAPRAKYHDDDSRIKSSFGGALLTGHGHRGGGQVSVIPSLYITKTFEDGCLCGWSVGLGVNSPFGQSTKYNHQWQGRYYANHSFISTVNINPSVAYRINECLSVGAGLNIMHLHGKFTNAVDFGSILFAATSGSLGTPQGQDGRVTIKGNSWGVGANAGLLWEINECTRIGVHYRSQVHHHIRNAHETFHNVPVQLASTFQNARARSKVTLPENLSVSAFHQLNSCWAIMGDVTWTRWSHLRELRFKFKSNQPDGVTTLHWKNTYRYALGVNYTPDECWNFRGGFMHDATPIRNKKLRDARLPDQTRTWLTLGAGYNWNNCLRIDMSYAHVFFEKAKIDKSGFELAEQTFKGGLKGHWDIGVDIFAVQANYTY